MKRIVAVVWLLVLLSACSMPLSPTVDVARVFSGTAQDHTAGAADLVALAFVGEDDVTFGSGSIEPSGAFSFELPEVPHAITPMAGAFCSGLEVSNAAASGLVVSSIDVTSGAALLGSIGQATSRGLITGLDLVDGGIIVRRVFADRNVEVQGSCDFSFDTYDLSLRQGWNVVLETYRELELGGFAVDSSVGGLPATAEWFFVD